MNFITKQLISKSLAVFTAVLLSALSSTAQSYCAGRGGPCGTLDNSWISSIALDVFTNSSACAATGYSDMTSNVINVVRGSTYTLSVTEAGVTGQDLAGAWIDWNKNGNLEDPDEIIAMSGTGLTPFTGNIVVPSGAALGYTRMRVRVLFSLDGPAAACGNTSYGEVEDYTINVLSCSPAPATPASIGGQASICANTVNTYSIASVSGATSYTWTVPSGMTITSGQGSTSISLTGTASGTISVTAANSCGASTPKTKAITIKPNPTANAGADITFCEGNSVQLSASGGGTYSWSPSTGLSNPAISNPVASPASMTNYTVTVTSTGGCTAVDEVSVGVNPAPTADAGQDVSICPGENVQLNASGNGTFQWTPAIDLSDPSVADPIATPTISMVYSVTVTGNNGCSASDAVSVTVNPAPLAMAGSDVTICAGQSAQLNATGGTGYSWTSSAGLSNPSIANPVANPPASVAYTVVVTDANGCSASDDIMVTVNAAPVVNPGLDVTICKGYTTPLNSGGTGSNTYLWAPTTGLNNPNISDPVASNTITTTYTVTVTNMDGCSSQGDVTVFVDLCNGVGNDSQDAALEVFPSPSAGDLFIESLHGSITGFQILDLEGKMVLNNKIEALQHAKIDISMLQQGIYIVKIYLDEEVVIKKIIRE